MSAATGTEWQEARQWMIEAGIIPIGHQVTKPAATLTEFAQCLMDGVFLCMLLNKMQPNAVPHFHPKAKLQFKCVQNINAFLASLYRDFKVSLDHVFDYGDLTDMSDFGRVVRCLSALSHSQKAISCGLIPFPSGPASHDYQEEDIYGNLENLAMQHYSTYSSSRPQLPATTAEEQESEGIYDPVDASSREEDIYGSLVSYSGRGKTQEGTGFGGLPEKMGFVVAEIVETEKNYLEALQMLTTHYIEPLSARLDADTCRTIFLNIAELVGIHKKFNASLEKQLSSSSKKFSLCFIESADDFVRYATYCAGLPDAQTKVQELMDKPATCQLLETCKKNSKQKFYLKELLSVPMQRMLKYPLLLRELIKQGKKVDWHDVLQLEIAAEGVQDVAKCVNEVKRDSERMNVAKDIKNGLVEYKGEDIANFGRSLFFGDIKIKTQDEQRPKPRYGFLFDRALLVCRPKSDKFIVKDVMKLEHYRVEDLHTAQSKAKFSSGFQMHSTTGASAKNCVIYAKTLNDKQEWLLLVQKAMTNIAPPHHEKGNHRFEQHTTNDMTTRCSVCTRLLWGLVLQGYQCRVCKEVTVHQNCLQDISDVCGRRPSVSGREGMHARPPPPRPGSHGAAGRNVTYRSIRQYTGHPPPPSGHALLFGLGEDVRVTQTTGEWWDGTLLKTNLRGVFPAAYVKLKVENQRQPFPYTETVIGERPQPAVPRESNRFSAPPPAPQGAAGDRTVFLHRFSWFVGKMSRQEAELHLLHSADGVYLIRESEARPGDYALSIKYEQPKHIRVNQKDGNYFLSQTKVFPSLIALVEHYQGASLAASFPGLETQLLVPFNDTTSLCVANYNFARRKEEELTIEEQQEIKIFSKETIKAKWWYGFNEVENAFGLFPSNYVTELGHH